MKNKIKILSLLLTSLLIGNAYTETTTGNFTASSVLNSSCSVSVADISFGEINPGVVNTTTGTLSVLCTNGTIFQAYASGGASKNMTNSVSGDTIRYIMRAPIGSNKVVGFWYSMNQIVGTSDGTTMTFPLSLSTIASYPTPGNYVDNVTVTLNY